MSTDLSEKGLETLIVDHMTSSEGGWLAGDPKDYEREYAVDLVAAHRLPARDAAGHGRRA